MDYENDHLVYPNLISAHIKTSNVLTPSASSSSSLPPPPPPSSTILRKIEESSAYTRPSIQRYEFTVEKQVLAKAQKQEDENNSTGEQSIELTLSDTAKNIAAKKLVKVQATTMKIIGECKTWVKE